MPIRQMGESGAEEGGVGNDSNPHREQSIEMPHSATTVWYFPTVGLDVSVKLEGKRSRREKRMRQEVSVADFCFWIFGF